jgi:hypothetical protein
MHLQHISFISISPTRPHPELMSWFKTYIAYKEDPARVEGAGVDTGDSSLLSCLSMAMLSDHTFMFQP